MVKMGPKIWVACAARDPYFRDLFANCVSPVNQKLGLVLILTHFGQRPFDLSLEFAEGKGAIDKSVLFRSVCGVG